MSIQPVSFRQKCSPITVLLLLPWLAAAQTETHSDSQPSTTQLRAVVNQAFVQTHDGFSSDEVILQTELNQRFIATCREKLPETDAATFNWTLLNMRKAGLLKTKATKRNRVELDDVKPIAEIAARSVLDRTSVSTDRIMADPALRSKFDAAALKIDPDIDLYRVRKAAFQLRKQRKLKPELIVRIADWDRQITTHKIADLQSNIDVIPEHPGIYIFRDETGYLYIGQSDNLQKRLTEHLDESHNFSLAKYLSAAQEIEDANISIEIHSFPKDSRAAEVMIRRAYESELIRSRKPRFNIQP